MLRPLDLVLSGMFPPSETSIRPLPQKEPKYFNAQPSLPNTPKKIQTYLLTNSFSNEFFSIQRLPLNRPRGPVTFPKPRISIIPREFISSHHLRTYHGYYLFLWIHHDTYFAFYSFPKNLILVYIQLYFLFYYWLLGWRGKGRNSGKEKGRGAFFGVVSRLVFVYFVFIYSLCDFAVLWFLRGGERSCI